MNFENQYELYVSRGFAFGEEQWEKESTYDSLIEARLALKEIAADSPILIRYRIVRTKLIEVGLRQPRKIKIKI